jgi:vitamin B12 transporter
VYDANFVGHPVNLPGSTRQSGVEVALAARLAEGWRIDASYTHLDAPQARQVTFDAATGATGTFTGQAVRRAADIASANLTYAPTTAPYSATLTVRYNGPQKDIFFGFFPPLLVALPAFTLVNLNATYAVAPHVELFGRVENLLDRRYVEVVSFAAPGRSAYGGVRVRY